MAKLTWQQLGRIYEGAYGVTVEEAAKIISKEIFGRNWKHGSGGECGRMWGDEVVVANFTQVLEEEDRLAKKFGRKKAVKELFKSKQLKIFIIIAKLQYSKSGYKTFKNDYGKWKKLKVFKNVWKKGKRTSKKLDPRLEMKLSARVRAADKILKASNEMMAEGIAHTKKLLESGEYEKIKDMQGNISLRKIPK
jgi:hypothetical protein